MKLYTLLCALTAMFGTIQAHADSTPSTEAVSTINWMTDYQAAQAKAKAESKPMFLYFTGSDWCPWCKKMDSEILATPDFQQAVGQKMIFVKVDFPRNVAQDPALTQQNKELKSRYDVSGFPTAWIVNANGDRIEKMGYQAGGGAAYAKKVLDVLNTKK